MAQRGFHQQTMVGKLCEAVLDKLWLWLLQTLPPLLQMPNGTAGFYTNRQWLASFLKLVHDKL
jgi:hypothetical protein